LEPVGEVAAMASYQSEKIGGAVPEVTALDVVLAGQSSKPDTGLPMR
jgi:hypothetical protein